MDTLLDLLIGLYWPMHYFLIFGILLVCGLGLPLPEDIALAAAGMTAYWGFTKLPTIIVVSYAGVLLGDLIIFSLGAKYGKKLTRRWLFQKLIPNDRLNTVHHLFHQKGNKLIFTARFMPGLRAPIYFSAGTLHLPYRVFLFYDGVAALISVPVIIGLVYHFGDEVDWVVRMIRRVEHGIAFAIFLVIFVIIGKWYITHRKLKRDGRK